MRQLSGQRGWEYAYRKSLEEKLEVIRDYLARAAVKGNLQFWQGQFCGIRDAIDLLNEAQKNYRLDDDVDLAS